MPVFMGVNKQNSEELFNKMTFTNCIFCGEVQIDELLEPNLIYQNNHNTNIVGKTWQEHYRQFNDFIGNDVNNKIILEISDPIAKIARLAKNFKSWYIVEPNPTQIEIENVKFIKQFFDDKFNLDCDIDVIVHSHFLEHVNEPKLFFKKCSELLKQDGTMFISIPDMEYMLKNNYSPNNILHFEHTYYLNTEILEYLSNLYGFKIEHIKKYNDHSIFYKLKKDISILPNNIKVNVGNQFMDIFNKHIDNIQFINKKIKQHKDYDLYFFSAHVSSQFYLFNGIEKRNIKLILDNDANKHTYKLYGTNLLVSDPSVIKDNKKCIIVCSHIGIYADEIKKQIIQLNKDAIIL
jgi:SAM-dependent methyltransferase